MLASLPRAAWWLIAVVAAVAWFGALDARRLQHPDEGRYAEIAREMAASGDWVTPRLNDLKYFEKPPLQYWAGAATFEILGTNEWTARLPPAVAGFLAVLAVGFTAARLAGPDAGAFAALALVGCVWHVGLSHLLTLDAMLSFWLTVALCAFLLAQRVELTASAQRNWMLAAYVGLAAATLTKGLVALVIPGGALVVYTIATRDFGPWRRLHLLPGAVVYFALTVPWFVLVSAANPEFARFFFVHEHVERFLSESHNRTGEWYYFVQWFLLGIIPWLLVWIVTLPRSWRDAEIAANGFAWEKFCVAWTALVFVFFSASGSKLPSYILPMFPALALILGFELTRLSSRALAWISLPLAIGAPLLLVAFVAGQDRIVDALANPQTPPAIYEAFAPWIVYGLAVFSAGGIGALALFRNGSAAAKSAGIAALSLSTLIFMQFSMIGHDAFASVRSAHAILDAAQRANGQVFDPAFPVFQIGSYDQTLPFYLGRPTPPVDYRDEMTLGLIAEPNKGYNLPTWIEAWSAAPQAYALTTPSIAADLERQNIPMRVLARGPRHVFVARR